MQVRLIVNAGVSTTAMLGKNWKAEIFKYCVCSL
jgi:hypothetical protein